MSNPHLPPKKKLPDWGYKRFFSCDTKTGKHTPKNKFLKKIHAPFRGKENIKAAFKSLQKSKLKQNLEHWRKRGNCGLWLQSVCVGSSRFWQPQDMCGPLLVTLSATSVVQLPPCPHTHTRTHTRTHTHNCMHASISAMHISMIYFERTEAWQVYFIVRLKWYAWLWFVTFFFEIWDRVSCLWHFSICCI